ncbi:MAG: hypothetical protein QXV83_00875 [Candidatus Anstonellaceae archaeon]
MQKQQLKKKKILEREQKNYFKKIFPKVSKISKKVETNIKKIEEDLSAVQQKGEKSIKKTLKALKKASKILKLAKKAKLSPFFVSPDLVPSSSISKELSKKLEESLQKKIELKKEIDSGLVSTTTERKISIVERIRRMVLLLIRKIMFLLGFYSNSKVKLTPTGKKALEQLNDLYNLLLLELYDESSLALLRLAYGEASFYITQASREYYKKHKGRGRENYQEYFDRFVKSVSSITP